MRIGDISLIGWVHTLACIAALIFGVWILAARKGGIRHVRMGRYYVYAMLVMLFSSFAIVSPGRGLVFNIFDWTSVLTLACLLLGWFAASRQRTRLWAYVHPVSMLASYWLLAGGLVNESYSRMAVLRDFALRTTPSASNVFQTMAMRVTFQILALIFYVLLAWFLMEVAARRARSQALAERSGYSSASAHPG